VSEQEGHARVDREAAVRGEGGRGTARGYEGLGHGPGRASRRRPGAVARAGSVPVLAPVGHYAGRDWGFIGHMAILVASSVRLLDTIGWQHAEHVLRYVVQGRAGWGKGDANPRHGPAH